MCYGDTDIGCVRDVLLQGVYVYESRLMYLVVILLSAR